MIERAGGAQRDAARTEIAELDKQIEEINSLESATRQHFIARMEVIEKLQRSRPEIVHVFDEIVAAAARGRVPHRRQADRQASEVRRRRAVVARACPRSCATSTAPSG